MNLIPPSIFERKNWIIAGLAALVILLLITNLHTCSKKAFDCDSCTKVITVVHDTVYPKDKPVIVYEAEPVPAKSWPVKKVIAKADTVYLPGNVTVIHDRCPESPATACDSGHFYAYNDTVGSGALSTSKLRKIINGDVKGDVYSEFLRWDKITVKGEKRRSQGLHNRRVAEADLYTEGKY